MPSARAVGILLIAAACVAGCSQEIRSQANATVSIDGKDQGQALTVRCNQSQSSWFFDIGDNKSNASAIVDVVGDKVEVQTVTIRGYGGFTGSYYKGGEQTADANLTNRRFTISGTASGLKTGVSGTVTTPFKITARC
jgi:Mycobacterium 19 kDa lipoprotein antigen